MADVTAVSSPRQSTMPTHTPSPHRFLPPRATLRNNLVATASKSAAEARDILKPPSHRNPPAKRFVVVPHRRSHSAEEKRPDNGGDARPLSHTLFTPRPTPTTNLETGEDEDENLFLTEQRSKRRRVSPGSSSTSAQPSEPTTPVAPPHNSTTPRFLVPPPPPHTPASSNISSAQHRPAFILPPQPTSPPQPSRSLPEVFSPSRKTQKYTPNGLASTLQAWIIETANTGFAAHEHNTGGGVVWARDRQDGVRLKMRVKAASSSRANVHGDVECFPGHFVFVQGDAEPGLYNASRAPGVANKNSGESRVVLAGQGSARSSSSVSIRMGGLVGLRAPMWQVDVAGEKWMVAVDWVLL